MFIVTEYAALTCSITLWMLSNIVCFLLSAKLFLKSKVFQKFFQEYHLGVRSVWIQIRPDVLSRLNWVQTVFKCYEQMTLAGKDLNKIYGIM